LSVDVLETKAGDLMADDRDQFAIVYIFLQRGK